MALYMEHTDDMPDVGFAYRLKVRRVQPDGRGSRAYIAYTVDSGSGGGSDIKYRRTTSTVRSWAVSGGALADHMESLGAEHRRAGRRSSSGLHATNFAAARHLSAEHGRRLAGQLLEPCANAGAFAAEVGFAGKSIVILRIAIGSGDNVFASNRTP